ncbi:MAG: NRDE family protein [Planctomycetota bacterium]|jgi:hypothetical protein
MCTLTFLPGLPGGGYLLATNRDESPERGPAWAPMAQEVGARQLIAPRDSDKGGTWVGVDDRGMLLAVLNGDRPDQVAEPVDPISRGQLVNDLLADPRFSSVRDELERRRHSVGMNYRPFKLVCVSPGPMGGGRPAHILRGEWTGSVLAFEELSGPRCAVSSTFETEAVTNYRRAAYDRFLQEHDAVIRAATAADAGESVIDELATRLAGFHAGHRLEAPDGDAYTVCMHREDARTVSSTLVLVTATHVTMRYTAGWPCQDGESVVVKVDRHAE